MPFNTVYGKLSSNIQISRVKFCPYSEREDFLEAVVLALKQKSPLVYIGTMDITDIDIEAASHIAWLRAHTYTLSPDKYSVENHRIGAIGEWSLLRPIKCQDAVKTVSLVSFSGVPEPDFSFVFFDSATQKSEVFHFDIKSTASKKNKCFYYNAAKHDEKGAPHILGMVLDLNIKIADVFVVHASELFTEKSLAVLRAENEYKAGDPFGSLHANLI
ncbi:hypothetical protein HH213_17155 [Duganella dendranthematis]|uniref:Uncharacterized protein n=1 Tax=Duganella dendranthematis TaxID=2728021 RepID=A0ABX6MCS6_9BURK|nr:hypothetical protein [Duganella dendranthematis]QJD91662.1 hypothetical protein HH213_17155 [Duganella dendranthematis]